MATATYTQYDYQYSLEPYQVSQMPPLRFKGSGQRLKPILTAPNQHYLLQQEDQRLGPRRPDSPMPTIQQVDAGRRCSKFMSKIDEPYTAFRWVGGEHGEVFLRKSSDASSVHTVRGTTETPERSSKANKDVRGSVRVAGPRRMKDVRSAGIDCIDRLDSSDPQGSIVRHSGPFDIASPSVYHKAGVNNLYKRQSEEWLAKHLDQTEAIVSAREHDSSLLTREHQPFGSESRHSWPGTLQVASHDDSKETISPSPSTTSLHPKFLRSATPQPMKVVGWVKTVFPGKRARAASC